MTSPSSVIRNVDNDQPACCHHWVIQPATGPLSLGVCQLCSESREFKNYLEDRYWQEYNSAIHPKKGESGVDNQGTAEDDDSSIP